MDFIERIFGISPDGGSGAFEFLLFALPIAGIAFLVHGIQPARRLFCRLWMGGCHSMAADVGNI